MLLETHDILISSIRWFLGLVLGVGLGLFTGLLMSLRSPLVGPFSGIADFLRAVPILGLVPVVQYFFGVSETGKIGLIAWAILFPVAYSVRNSITDVPQDTQLLLRRSQKRNFRYFELVVWRGALQGVIRAVSVSIGIAWLVVVAAEMIGTYTVGFWRGGLGYRLFRAYEVNDPIGMFLILILFGLLGMASGLVWSLLSRRIR